MLVKTVSFNDFLEEFIRYGRADSFSYKAKKALYNYLNELSDDIGEPIELDVIGLCGEFTEYDSIEEFNHDYSYTIDEINSIDEIEYYTTVIRIDDERFIIQDF